MSTNGRTLRSSLSFFHTCLRLTPIVVAVVLAIVTGGSARAATIVVPPGGDFQAALNAAHFGDTIVLQASATYTSAGTFVLPNKGTGTGTDADYITIQTSGTLPSGRLDPAASVGQMAKLTSSRGYQTVSTAVGAHHYKLIGLEITTNGNVYTPDVVDLGADANRTQQVAMKNFVIDRCFIHPAEISASNLFPSTLLRSSGRGVGLATADTWVINSYIAGFAGRYLDNSATIDSYGVYSPVGPGPYHIVNNYIEAQFNNVFLGGADCDTPNKATVSNATFSSATLSNVNNLSVGDLVAMSSGSSWQDAQINSISGNNVTFTIATGLYSPTPAAPDNGGTARWNGDHIHDVEVRGNSLWKPDAWNAFSNPKSYVEVKDCVNCVINGNDMYSGVGTAIALTVRNQNGSAPWATIRNLTFSNNRINGYQNFGFGIQLKDNERPSITGGNVTITNNLLINERGSSPATFVGINGGDGVTVSHNTILQSARVWAGFGSPATNVVFKDNIANSGPYGPTCDISPSGLGDCWPGYVTSHNVIIDNRNDPNPPLSSSISGSNYHPRGASAVGFTDLTNNNYRLAVSSPYRNAASDGKDIGVDIDVLNAALGGAAPTPTPTPTATPTATPTPTPTATPTATPTPTPTATPTATPTPTPKATPTPASNPGPAVSASASFVRLDASTEGNWKGAYGIDGYNIISDTTKYPSYAQVTPSGQTTYVWDGSTSDLRALQKADISGRLAATWHSYSVFTIDVNLTDSLTHSLALYCVDWDNYGRAQLVDVVDATSNALLDTRSLSGFQNGQYAVWNVRGHVRLNFTRTAGINAVVSGLLFGPAITPTAAPTANPIDDAAYFVRQDYFDLLSRTPDTAGLVYWTEQITGNSTNTPAPCPLGDKACVLQRRVSVSAAFFIEAEFQQTGGFVYRFYKSSLGRKPGFAEFSTDRAQVVGGANLGASKLSFADAWVQRTEFLQKYPASLGGAQFVDALIQTVFQSSGVDISASRTALVNDYLANGSRARIVTQVADNQAFAQAEYNPAFVLMQYFGYLRRDPDQGGYDFWLNVLNNRVPNNYRSMACAFITSSEYQFRFGPILTHTNAECGL